MGKETTGDLRALGSKKLKKTHQKQVNKVKVKKGS